MWPHPLLSVAGLAWLLCAVHAEVLRHSELNCDAQKHRNLDTGRAACSPRCCTSVTIKPTCRKPSHRCHRSS